MSRAHPINTLGSTLTEYATAAQAAIDADAAQPAFFLARQLAELSLKALHPNYTAVRQLKVSHSLTDFLDALAALGDPLLGAGETEQDVVAFIRDLAHHDGTGDQGRYYTTRNGAPSLATVCCADRDLLSKWVWMLENYIIDRLEPGCIRPFSS
ncbi:hypothetical protein [Nocardia salmonicida]|uniref:hypothetical protein n=1 Tax=Nocardia salmonicida TaxID=53431 RepID=UPI002E29B7E8|nr:hypothetical protein [Nocardia salmonicida]